MTLTFAYSSGCKALYDESGGSLISPVLGSLEYTCTPQPLYSYFRNVSIQFNNENDKDDQNGKMHPENSIL